MKTTKKALNAALRQLTNGTAPKPVRIAAYALEGLPVGGWPETAQAKRMIENELPSDVDADDFIAAAYTVTNADRYTSKF